VELQASALPRVADLKFDILVEQGTHVLANIGVVMISLLKDHLSINKITIVVEIEPTPFIERQDAVEKIEQGVSDHYALVVEAVPLLACEAAVFIVVKDFQCNKGHGLAAVELALAQNGQHVCPLCFIVWTSF
jgi:hypothetical protein